MQAQIEQYLADQNANPLKKVTTNLERELNLDFSFNDNAIANEKLISKKKYDVIEKVTLARRSLKRGIFSRMFHIIK